MPVHGEYLMLKEHARIAIELGIPKENCFVLDSGDALSFNERGAKVLKKKIPTSDVYLDSSLSDVDSNILKERKKMADEGLISIIFTISKNRKLIGQPLIKSSGFADYEVSRSIENTIKQKAIDIFTNILKTSKTLQIKKVEKEVSVQLSQYIYQKIERRPLIVPIINTIDKE